MPQAAGFQEATYMYVGVCGDQRSIIRAWPQSYVVVAFDLHPKNPENVILKYEDGFIHVYLLVTFRYIHSVSNEMENSTQWEIAASVLTVTRQKSFYIYERVEHRYLSHCSGQ